MIKVLYESSVLNLAQTNNCAKTGIYRVIDELLRQLLKHDDITVYPFIKDFLYEDTLSLIDVYGLNREQYLDNSQVWNKDNIRTKNFYQPLYRSREKLMNREKLNPFSLIHRKTLSFFINHLRKNLMKESILDISQYDLCHFLTYDIDDNFKNMKSLYTIYDLIPVKFPELLASDNVRKVYVDSMKKVNENTWITCISESTRNDLLNSFPNLDPDRVFVNYISVSDNIKEIKDEQQLSSVLNKYNLDMHSDYLISVSTIEPRKNMITVLKAFKRLIENSHYKDLKLVLVGPHGWKVDDLINEINFDNKLKERVIFTGFVSNDELSALYTKARIFLYPSLYEGFGIPPLEAMRCGTPVITSNCSSLPEVVGDGGIMVNPLDAEEIEYSIKKILEDTEFTHDLLSKAEKRVSMFSWERYGNEIKDLYSKISNA